MTLRKGPTLLLLTVRCGLKSDTASNVKLGTSYNVNGLLIQPCTAEYDRFFDSDVTY